MDPTANDGKTPEWAEQVAALSKLSDEELFDIGVTSTDAGWAVAWSTDSRADREAIQGALGNAGVMALGSCGRGRCGWYVSSDDFFLARRALKGSLAVRKLGIEIAEPRMPSKQPNQPDKR